MFFPPFLIYTIIGAPKKNLVVGEGVGTSFDPIQPLNIKLYKMFNYIKINPY